MNSHNDQEMAARDGAAGNKPARNGLVKRGVTTTRRLWFRLSRPVSRGMPAVWSAHMVTFSIVAVLITLFVSIFDPLVQPFAYQSQYPMLRFMVSVTDAAKSGWYIVPAVIVIAIIGLLDWQKITRKSRKALMAAYGQAAFIFVSVAATGIATNIIKQFVGRARPRLIADTGAYGFYPFQFDAAYQSFPSGHATTAGALAVILMLWHPGAKWPLFVVMAALASARIPAGAHYPSDVVAGYSIGAIFTLAFARWLARRRAVFTFRHQGPFPVLIGT
jgi:membrane-associated phospholipid phosphatase